MKEYMSSYERCLAAIGLQEVDRIPTDLHDFLMCAEDSGMDLGQFVLDDGKMAEMLQQPWPRLWDAEWSTEKKVLRWHTPRP